MKVGIDAIAWSTPKTSIHFDGEWTTQRAPLFANGDAEGLREKINKGIGLYRMTVPDAHEDVVTLAANALLKLLQNRRIEIRDISHVLFASEGGVDAAKSASAYVLGALEKALDTSTSHIAHVEMKFACVASSYAIEYAESLIRSGMNSRRYVIVLTSDIARYARETAAEYTQGAGAVALALCAEPDLLELDDHPMATASSDERDFFRPLFKDTPTVDGKHSIDVYLNLVQQAAERYQESFFSSQLKATAKDVLADSAALLFHVPFPKMAEYMASRILLPLFDTPSLSLAPDLRAEREKEFRKSSEFRTLFSEKVEPGLRLSRHIGNIYSGSLPLSLASFFAHLAEHPEILKKQRRLQFFAYGSGACSRFYSGTLTQRSAATALELRLGQTQDDHPLRYSEYVALHDLHNELNEPQKREARESAAGLLQGHQSIVPPHHEFVFHGIRMTPTEQLGHREYSFCAE